VAELRVLKPAQKFLKQLSGKHLRQMMQALEALEIDPYPIDSKALKGTPYQQHGLRRKDVGEYRIVYTVKEEQIVIVTVVLIGKRNDDEVYRVLARLYGR
jgi:mRNA interferase RelE/StbE